MTLKNNRAPLLSNIKLYASFHHHMWIQTGVTVRKRLSCVVTSVTLTFDLWPWPFALTLLWSLVITPENFMMIRWWEHSQKGVTDGQTENTICRAAWSQLKTEWNADFSSSALIRMIVLVSILKRTRRSENYSTLGRPRSENASIGWAWPFQIVICFMVHCIVPPNYRP